MSQYADIIERLEKATGPDRAIDYMIADLEFQKAALTTRTADLLPHWTEEQRRSIIAAYTASLDAAISLVERMLPIHGRMMSKGRVSVDEPLYATKIYDNYVYIGEDPHELSSAEHECEPIALLLAMFRALEAEAKP